MQVDGIKEAKADYQRDWTWAKYDPAKVTPEKLVEAINKNTNFKASLPEKQKDKPPQR